MTKFVCLDFDGTLSDEQIAEVVKKILDVKKSGMLENVQFGIVTSRSIYDDFRTPGQFYHDIVSVLIEKGIELNFICTRFCLHVIDPLDYVSYDIPTAIDRASKYPIFGGIISDYLMYRAKHSELIRELKLDPSPKQLRLLKELVKMDIDMELALRKSHIEGKMLGDNTPKINQIETVISVYQEPIERAQVLLLDDAYKHVCAVQSYPCDNWVGCHYTGDIRKAAIAMHEFLGIKPSSCKHIDEEAPLIQGSVVRIAPRQGLLGLFYEKVHRRAHAESIESGEEKLDEKSGKETVSHLGL